MIFTIIRVVELIFRLLMLLIVVDAVLSFLMSPYHPLRELLGRFLNPLYSPIRRVVRPIGGLDFSPLILLILLQIVSRLVLSLLFSLT